MKFAKLYDMEDTQILLRLTLEPNEHGVEEEVIALKLTTLSDEGHEMSAILARGAEALEVFEMMDETFAKELRGELVNQVFKNRLLQ